MRLIAVELGNNNCLGFRSQNHGMIMSDAVVESSGSYNDLVFSNVHLNLSVYTSLWHFA